MRSFGISKLSSFLLPGTVFAAAGFAGRLVDSVIAGHLIGEDALAGINMVSPLLAGISFFACLIALGTSTNYSISMGRLDKVRANGFFVQGLWLALAAGGLMSVAMLVGEDAYFALLKGSEYVEMYGRQYLDWGWPIAFVDCLLSLVALICCVDGGMRLVAGAFVVSFVTKAAVTYCAIEKGMGASGCAVGTLVADTLAILIMCAHFPRKTCSLSPTWHFSLRDSFDICWSSFGAAASLLCDAILFLVINKLVIARFGSDLLPVAGVAIFLWSLMGLLSGVGLAIQPLVAVYWGERNMLGIRIVMRRAVVYAVAGGVLLALVQCAYPTGVIGWVGVEYPELVDESLKCVRLMSLACVPYAVASLFGSYYVFIERPLLSFVLLVLAGLVMPLACLFGGSFFGLAWTWGGLGGGLAAGLLVMGVAILAKCRRGMFPFLLTREVEAKIRMIGLTLEDAQIVKASEKIAKMMPSDVAGRAALLVEEVLMCVKERNRGRKVRAEVTVDFNDGIVMTLRDDGVIFDITDADAKVSSLRTYLVASVMGQHRERVNLVTTGFNRNVLKLR